MKTRIYLLAALAGSVALLTACGGPLDFRNADISNGKIYERGENAPYSGRVTNIPDGKFLGNRPGLQRLMQVVMKTIPNQDGYVDKLVFGSALCDINVSKGILDGAAVCKVGQSEILKFEIKFSDGDLDGDFRAFDLTDKQDTIVEATFKRGQPDGTVKMYSPASKKLVARSEWVNGKREGDEEIFYDTGTRYRLMKYKDGALSGPGTQYAPDGKTVTSIVNFTAGLPDGMEESFYPDTGKLLSRKEWKAGVLTGTEQAWGQRQPDQEHRHGQRCG